MKTRHTLLSMVLTLALTLPMFGQPNHGDTTKTDMKKHDMSSMMVKPIVDTTAEGLHMKVWVMTQKQHSEMMMHGENEGPVGQMEMTGMNKPSMKVNTGMNRLGRDNMQMKDTSMQTGKGMMGMKHDYMQMKDTSMQMGKGMMGMKHEGMGMSKAMRDSMMAGTHNIMLDVTDAATGKEIENASVRVLIETPSKKSSSVELRSMMSHFGGPLTLDEKGKYQFTVNVTVAGVVKTTRFQYAVN